MSGLFGGGGGSTTVVNNPAPMSDEEKALLALNTQLGQRQLANLDQIQPFQKQLLDLSMSQLLQNKAYTDALNQQITPEQQAAAAKADFDRAQRLGPIQDQLLQAQLDQIKSGGAATPEQMARINAATEAGITAGSADIDAQTARGIGLIADELANSRGLRLSDSPISSEAALLSREGLIQKGSLTKNLQAAGASAALNYPLAVQGMQSGINLNQQNILSAAQNFQNDLRQRAYQNRLALAGPATQGGIGLASIGNNYRPNFVRGNSQTTDTSNDLGLLGLGQAAGGFGQAAYGASKLWPLLAASDRRLKDDYGVVAKTEGGINLHLFKYKGEGESTPLRLGVMADEVEKVIPDAVATHSSGYKVVDYAKVN